MKLIIAGGRDLEPPFALIDGAMKFFGLRDKIEEIVEGGASGVDRYGRFFARGSMIPFKTFEADWATHGNSAGPKRNRQMAEYADALLLIWDGQSRGSKNMKDTMNDLGKPVYEIVLRKS